MKQTLFLAIVFAISNLGAQTEKGNFLVSSQIGINSSSSNYDYSSDNDLTHYNTSNKNVQFNLGIGYFVIRNLAIGIGSSYSNNTYFIKQTSDMNLSNTYEINNSTKNFSLLLFARKYIPLNNQFSFYGQIEIGGGPSKRISTTKNSNNPESNTTGKGDNLSAGLLGGVAWFPSKKFGLHAGIGNLGWNSSSGNTENNSPNLNQRTTYKNNGFNFNLNTATFQIGLSYFFGI